MITAAIMTKKPRFITAEWRLLKSNPMTDSQKSARRANVPKRVTSKETATQLQSNLE